MGAWFGTSRRGKMVGKGGKRVNTEQKMCTYICKWEMIPVVTTP
jgi:hypothetical protein